MRFVKSITIQGEDLFFRFSTAGVVTSVFSLGSGLVNFWFVVPALFYCRSFFVEIMKKIGNGLI